jgi:hypothetical protein
MGQHYTKNTVSTAAWCAKCGKETSHRVDDRRLGPCLVCIAKLDGEAKQERVQRGGAETQRKLF